MCLCCKFSQGIALAAIGILLLAVGIGGAVGFIYWDRHGGAKATYWVGIAFIVIGCIGFIFVSIAIGLAIWACYKECHRHKSPRAPAPAPAPQPLPPVQAAVQAPITNEVHHHHYPPPPAYYSPPPANYYPPPAQPYYPPPQQFHPNPRPFRHGDPSSALDTSIHP